MQSWSDRFGALLTGENFAGRLAFIGLRHDFLMSQLAGRVAPEYPFAVTTPDSAVDALSIELQGQGWIDVKEVYIEGRRDPLELTWTASGTGTSRTYFWSVTVALDPGPNTFTLLACDVQGRLVGSDSVTVTSTREARPLRDGLRVTELMYAPRGGGDYEFVEFRNTGPDVLDLTGVRFTDGIEYVFTNGAGSNVAPGEYVVLARDPADFAERYDTAAMNLAGPYAGAFANEGETVRLVDPLGSLIVEFQYADGRGWPLAADGGGHALVPLDRAMDDQPLGSLSYGGNWRAGTYIDGSPGAADPAPIRDARINEVAAHTDLADPAHPLYDSNDWIELFSLTNSPVSLADWYLSDDLDDLRKWAIPATNVLAANGFILFDEVSGFHNPITEGFGLDKAGEQVVLAHLPGTDEDRIVDAVRFKGQENGATLGRQPDGDGAWRALAPTPGAANMPPAGGLVIREFVYRPTVSPATPGDATGGAFIRIENPTAAAVALWNDAGPWRIDGGVSFTFPAGTALAAGGSLYVVSFDPADTNRLAVFEATYGLTNGQAAVLGPYSGVLSHRGERIALERPQAGDRTGDGPSWVIVDEVIYFAMDPFAVDLDGIGRGLLRIDPLSDGNDPANWRAMDPSLLLTLRWKLDESSGTTARNSGMGRRHGTLLDLVPGNADGNTPPAWSEGRFGNALEFDGVDDVVRLDEKVVAGFPFTLSAWVRSSAGAGIACAGFIGEVGQNERYYAIGMRDGKGEIAGHIAPHPFARLSAAGVTPIADGEWHHLAGVFLSATDKRLYVDGRLEATLTAPFAFTSSVNRCSIGLCDRPQRDAPWLGRIDDFRVHGIALTEDQLEAAAAEEPATPDEGGDRLPAAWAVEHFGATNAFNGGPSDDWDGDGLDNWGEYVAGTDPTNAASVFMLDIRGAGGVVFVEWTGRVAEGPNYEGMFRYYSLEERGILSAGDWDPVAGHTNLPGANAVLVYSNAAPGGVRFYRAKARLE